MYKKIPLSLRGRQEASFIFKDETAPAEGYEEWVGEKKAEPKPEWKWTNPLESFAFGAGSAGIGAALGTWGKKALAGGATGAIAGFLLEKTSALAGGVVGGPAGALAGGGLAAIMEFGGFRYSSESTQNNQSGEKLMKVQ